MKKFLIYLFLILFVAFFIGCKNTETETGVSGASSASSGGTSTTASNGLPASVGTDPFKGNTYQSSSSKYVFKTDGTFEVWENTPSGQWRLSVECEYTYNANTKIMSYKTRKMPAYEGSSMWTLAEYLSWVNGLADNSEMFQQTGMTRTQMCEYLNAWFNAITYEKCEEETYQGNLCLSKRDYYPQNTSLAACENSMDFSATGLDIYLHPSIAVQVGEGYGSVYIGSTRYDITAITGSTIIATRNNNAITLNYTKTWSDGVIYLNVSGGDSAAQTALSNQTFTVATSSSKYYYPKVTQ